MAAIETSLRRATRPGDRATALATGIAFRLGCVAIVSAILWAAVLWAIG